MPAPIAGIAYLKIDGVQYQLRGDLKINIGGDKREAIVGMDGIHGFKIMPVAPSIEGNITDSGGLSLKRITQINDTTVEAQLVNGKSYVLRNAWCADALELDAVEGQFTVKFEGISCEELLGATR